MMTSWCLLFFVMGVTVCGNEIRKTSCGPASNLTMPLNCAPSEWIHVISEQYSIPENGNCTVGLNCRTSLWFQSSGLDVSCNGEVGDDGVCEEPTDPQRWMADCVNGSDPVAVEVRYECIKGTDVMDLCSNETRTWTPLWEGMQIEAYLATPAFPNTPALSQHCTCNITGKAIWIQGLEVKADVGHSAPWLDVLTVSANGTELWSMQHSRGGSVRFLQEIILVSRAGAEFGEVSVSYQDYNLPGQLAWMRVRGMGDNLTLSCQSVSVPPPPSTTTTTTTTSTTTPIATTVEATTTTIPTVLSSTTTPTATTVGSFGGDRGSMQESTVGRTLPSAAGPGSPTSSSTGSPRRRQKDPPGKEEHTGVIVGLVILMLVLIAVTIVLGVIIWRRYQRAKKTGHLEQGGGGFGAFLGLQYWYNRRRHQRHYDRDPAVVDIPVSDFHNLEGISQGVGGGEGQDTGHYEAIDGLDLRLRPAPSSGAAVEEKQEKQREENAAPVSREAQDGSSSRPSSSQEGSARAVEKSSAEATEDPSGLSSRKKQFVARVLDETLESIINQREALATTPPPHPSPSPTGSVENSAAVPGEGGGRMGAGQDKIYAIPNLPPPPLPLSKETRDGGDVYAKPNKLPPISKESGEGDIYAKPNKRPPLSKGSQEGSDVYVKPNTPEPFSEGTGEGDYIYAKPDKGPAHAQGKGEGSDAHAESSRLPPLARGSREEESNHSDSDTGASGNGVADAESNV